MTMSFPDGEATVQIGSEVVPRSQTKKVGKPGLGWNQVSLTSDSLLITSRAYNLAIKFNS